MANDNSKEYSYKMHFDNKRKGIPIRSEYNLLC